MVHEMIGVPLATICIEHQYIITEPLPSLKNRKKEVPVVRDPDRALYFKPEAGGKVLIGGFEKGTVPVLGGKGLLPFESEA